jgi:hypothetical protein
MVALNIFPSIAENFLYILKKEYTKLDARTRPLTAPCRLSLRTIV